MVLRSMTFLVSAVLVGGTVWPAGAASVNCPPGSGHPVCKANYAAHPKGAHPPVATGTATVNGKQVRWSCKSGSDNPPTPRRCTY
jgi:hypothetical protein